MRVVQTFVTSEQPPKARPAETRCVGCNIHVSTGTTGRSTSGGHRSSGGGGGSVSVGSIDGEAAAALAVVVVASAAVIAVVAAGSEGARYDGWARVEGNHPLHLYGPNDDYRLVSLDDLTMEEAEWATRAYMRESEGNWQGLARAPLNRQGWAYSVFLGAGLIGDMAATASPGTISHIQLGYFPTHELGLHVDIGFGWGGPSNGKIPGTRFEARAALEAQLMPFQSGKVHAGVFGQIGNSLRTAAAGGGTSDIYSAGGLMQLDLTTRLAVTGRAGLTRAYGESATELSLGLSIY